MNTICLFGGGRWSRVLLNVLLEGFPQLESIIWVTKNNYTQNVAWLKSQNITMVKIIQDKDQVWDLKPQAAIVATSSYSHSQYLKEILLRKIPVLSEKPFCFTPTEARELIYLSKQLSIVAGVNFEFTYASYLHDFNTYVNSILVHTIDIVWQDSFYETRYGEKKIGDVYTPLIQDSFQHCWSLLRVLLPKESLSISSVAYCKNSCISIEARTLTKRIKITLSRRSTQRDRIISVNNGEMVLNFSLEPGQMSIHGEKIKIKWRGHRPLLAVFTSFFDAIKEPELFDTWPLNICNCLDVVDLSAQAAQMLDRSQMEQLEKINPLLAQDTMTRNLLIDMFLPNLAAAGEYHRAHNIQEQIAFADHVIRIISIHSVRNNTLCFSDLLTKSKTDEPKKIL